MIMIIIQGLISAVSPGMRIQSAMKCHCYLTQKQHTTVLQPAGAKTTQRQHRNTRHNDISLLEEKEIMNFMNLLLEFSGL
jgi:hypothetical protein